MKKGRTGVLLSVLCIPGEADAMADILFAETTTFGVRRLSLERVKFARRFETVETTYGEIRMKIGQRRGIEQASPEFENCRRIALENKVPVRDVMAAANVAWFQRTRSGMEKR